MKGEKEKIPSSQFPLAGYTRSMKKAMIAPVVFAVLTMLFVIGYAAVLLWIPLPLVVKLGIALIVLALIVAMGYVVIERSREIKKEEQDDFSKY